MAKTYHDADADLSLIQAKKVAIIGYGSQGHAHALNLKDSGVDVRVGLRPDSPNAERARKAGLVVDTVANDSKIADVFNIRFRTITPPPTADVSLVAPKGPGHRVREVFTEGGGIPGLVAVEQNASG